MDSTYPVLAIILLRVTPSAKRNSYRVAILFCINTQGRGAAHLNPGLWNRNSYRVARGAHHPQWATYIIVIPLRHQRKEDDMRSDTPNRPTPPYYIYRAHPYDHPEARKKTDRAGAMTSISSCFSTGDSRTFFTAAGRFLNRGGCCRHAAHDGGGGDDGKEENSFSDGHWHQPHQGEADSIRHGFLYLPHPLAASTSGGRQPRRYPQPPRFTLLYI